MSDSKLKAVLAGLRGLGQYSEGTDPQEIGKRPPSQSSEVSTNIREPIESEMSNAYWKPVADKAKVEPDEVRRLSLEFGEDIVENLTPEQVKDAVIKYVRD